MYADKVILQDVKSSLEKMNEEYSKYIKSQLILNVCEALTTNDGLTDELCDKIDTCLIMEEFHNDCLENNPAQVQTFNIFGINSALLEEYKLTPKDKAIVKSKISQKLTETCSEFDVKLKKLMKADLLVNPNHNIGLNTILPSGKNTLLKCCTQFKNCLDEYNSLIDFSINLINESLSLRIVKYNKLMDSFDTLDKRAELVNLKANILKYKVEQMIFSVNDKIVIALLLLYDRLKEKEDNVFMKIESSKTLLDDYKKLEDVDEFKTIVEQYRVIKKQIKHLEWTLQVLNC